MSIFRCIGGVRIRVVFLVFSGGSDFSWRVTVTRFLVVVEVTFCVRPGVGIFVFGPCGDW